MTKTAPRTFTRPTLPRNPKEAHRPSTPLELLFDLVSVIAIAAAAGGLHHAVSDAHAIKGIITYLMAFFAIWWAWMNYTWFASAYDNDDTVFRLLTMTAMAGSLVIATGISQLFDSFELTVVILGYVIMRLAMIALWLRAAKHDTARRKTALTYAVGIAIAQFFWVTLLFYQPTSAMWFYTLFGFGVVLELLVPAVAEHSAQTPWHKHHIIERYGLLFIIVMGELLLAGTLALKAAFTTALIKELVPIAIASLVISFSMWWLYFAREEHLQSDDTSNALMWGYGHFTIYSSAAAVGAGLAVHVDILTGHSKVGMEGGALSVAIPLVVYLLGLWFIRDRICLHGPASWVLPLFAGIILIVAFLLHSLLAIAVLLVLSVFTRNGLVPKTIYRSSPSYIFDSANH